MPRPSGKEGPLHLSAEPSAADPQPAQAEASPEAQVSETYQEYSARNYEQVVKSAAQSLRDLADDFERKALDRQIESERVHAASRAYHALMWGLANASTERIISAAAQADDAER